jgi:hypothetical protein
MTTQKNLRAFTISGSGTVVQTTTSGRVQEPTAKPAKLMHRLTTPEKRTLKRIEALRTAMVPGAEMATAHTIKQHLLADRGLHGQVDIGTMQALAQTLVNPALATVPTTTLVAQGLRAVGALQRAPYSLEDVKRALVVVSDAVYGSVHNTDLLAQSVRDVDMERRDGGIQLRITLRQQADKQATLDALRRLLQLRNVPSIDIRIA